MSEVTMAELQGAVESIRESLVRHDEQLKTIMKRVDAQEKLTESVHQLAMSVNSLTQEQRQLTTKIDTTNERLESVSDDVEDLKQKPAKRYDSVVSVVLTAIITAGLTLILTQIGLK